MRAGRLVALLLVACVQALSPASIWQWAFEDGPAVSALETQADGDAPPSGPVIPLPGLSSAKPEDSDKKLEYQHAKAQELAGEGKKDGHIRTPTGVEPYNDNAPCGSIDNETGVRVGPCNATAHRYRRRLPSKPVNFTKTPKPVAVGKQLSKEFYDPATGRRSQTATDVVRKLPPPVPKLKPKDEEFASANPGKFQCSRAANCQACVSRESMSQQCGWCASSPSGAGCFETMPDGTAPAHANCTGEGTKWNTGFCPGESCKGYFSCDACLKDPFCGWCQNEKKCIEGDESGPLFGLCAEWVPHSCPAIEEVSEVDKRIVESSKPVDYGDCCTPRFNASCSNDKISFCVCKRDPYCCKLVWDDTCIKHVQDFDCGSCPFQPCPNECMDHGVCQIHTGECKCDPGWGDIDCSKKVDIVEQGKNVKKKKYPVRDTRRVNKTVIVANKTIQKETNETYTRMADEPPAPAPKPVKEVPKAPAPAPKKTPVYAPVPAGAPFPEIRKKRVTYNKICYTSAENCTYGCNADICRLSKFKNYSASLNCTSKFENSTARQKMEPKNDTIPVKHLMSNGDSWSTESSSCCGPECQRQKAAYESCQKNCSETCTAGPPHCFKTFTNVTYPEFRNASKIVKADLPKGLVDTTLLTGEQESDEKPAPAPSPAPVVQPTKNVTYDGVPPVDEPGSNCTALDTSNDGPIDKYNASDLFKEDIPDADGSTLHIMKRPRSSNQSCSELGWNTTCYQGAPTICMQTQHVCQSSNDTVCEDNGCSGLKTYEQAKLMCEVDMKARLCTYSELLWNQGQNNPCTYNKQLTWTDTRCEGPVDQVKVMNAAGTLGDVKREARCVPMEAAKIRAMVVCCADTKPLPIGENNATMDEVTAKRVLEQKKAQLVAAEKSGDDKRIQYCKNQVDQAEKDFEDAQALRKAEDDAIENRKKQLAAEEEIAAAKAEAAKKQAEANKTTANASQVVKKEEEELAADEEEMRSMMNGTKSSTASAADKAAITKKVQEKRAIVAEAKSNLTVAKASEEMSEKQAKAIENSTAVKRAREKQANASKESAAVESNLADKKGKTKAINESAAKDEHPEFKTANVAPPKPKNADEVKKEREEDNAPEFVDEKAAPAGEKPKSVMNGDLINPLAGNESEQMSMEDAPASPSILSQSTNTSNFVPPNLSSGENKTVTDKPKKAPAPAPSPSLLPNSSSISNSSSVPSVGNGTMGNGTVSNGSSVVPSAPNSSSVPNVGNPVSNVTGNGNNNSSGGGNNSSNSSLLPVLGSSNVTSPGASNSSNSSSLIPGIGSAPAPAPVSTPAPAPSPESKKASEKSEFNASKGNSSNNSSLLPQSLGLGGNTSSPSPAPSAAAPAPTPAKTGAAPAPAASNSTSMVPGLGGGNASPAPAPSGQSSANTTASPSPSPAGSSPAPSALPSVTVSGPAPSSPSPSPAKKPAVPAPAPVPTPSDSGILGGGANSINPFNAGPAPAPISQESDAPRKLPPTVAAPEAENDENEEQPAAVGAGSTPAAVNSSSSENSIPGPNSTETASSSADNS